MRHLKRSFGCLTLVAAALCALPAAATTWDSSGHSTSSSPSACLTSGMPNTDLQPCQMTVTVGSEQLKVRAYSTRANGSTGLWRSAVIQEYSGGGFAVHNVTVDANGNTIDWNEGSQPEHATDNSGAFDMLVFELPSTGFDIEAFKLGWAQEDSTYGSADIQAWFGGNDLGNDFNFSTACFSGCTNTSSGSDPTGGILSHLGLTDITSTMNNTGGSAGDGGEGVPVNTSINFTGVQSGKYLVLSGQLGESNDFFKVKSISGSPGGPGGSAPTPGTVALLGLGLAGLVTMRRRKAKA